MLKIIEQFLIDFLIHFYSLSHLVGIFTLGALSVVLFIIQFYKQKETYIYGAIGLLFAWAEYYHFFKPETAIEFLEKISVSINATNPTMTPLPLVEKLFEWGIAPYMQRNVVEEMIFVAFLGYVVSVAYYVITDPARNTDAVKGSVFDVLKSGYKRPQRSKGNELGSGDLASTEQIKRWITPCKEPGVTKLLVEGLRASDGTIFKKATMYIPREVRNQHILIVAKTGGGKTTKLILPVLYNDCFDKTRSTIVIDSKPEMWKKLAGMTRKYNPDKEILLFNPLDTARSLSWNILGKIKTDTDAKLIADTIIRATDNPMARSDSPFFRNNALAVLNAIFVGLLHDPNDTLSMPRVHELIQSGNMNLAHWLEAHPESIRTSKTFVELVKSGSQNADTIMSELGMRVSAWDIKAIRATTCFNELDLETLIQKPTLFIVELRESEIEMLRPMANVIVTELLRFLTKRAENCPNTCLPRPVGLVIDEFASSLGRLPDIHVKLNTLRSRNISIVAAVQSLAQIKANYQDDADSVIAGFGTKIFMPNLDVSDAEWASKESGQMTIRFKTESTGLNKKLTEIFASKNDSSQEQVQQRPVLTPDEIGKPADNINTFFMPNTPVFQGFLVPFYKVPVMLERLTEFDTEDFSFNLRISPIPYEEKTSRDLESTSNSESYGTGNIITSSAGTPQDTRFTDTTGWSQEKIKEKLEEVKKLIGWEETSGSARKWWLLFEEENAQRLSLVLRVAEELLIRNATISEFFLAYVYSGTDNIQANLHYLDFLRLKNKEEVNKKKVA